MLASINQFYVFYFNKYQKYFFLMQKNIKFKILSFFFNWDSLHARLNSHSEAWIYKKRSIKKITGYRKSVYKEPTVKRFLLILDLKVKGEHSNRQRIPPEFSCARKETVDIIDILVTSRNGDRKIMHAIYQRIMSRPLPWEKGRGTSWSQFWRTSTKVIAIEKT